MKNIEIVIGASFGDEGKGITTDFLCRRPQGRCAVVRFNGGAQAGHTVVTPDGKRHAFQHFGSGTLAGKPTILSKFFMVNPLVFFDEAEQLRNVGAKIFSVFVDPMAKVTTPVDVLINRALERSRDKPHGSCGLGINETECRNEVGYTLYVKDIGAPDFDDKLREIAEVYMPARLCELELSSDLIDPEELSDLMVLFKRDAKDFVKYAKVYPDAESFELFDHLVFEGAQGLRLSQDSVEFPHVTRSYTGLRNVLELIKGLDCVVTAYYVTRTYLTRHGAGPLDNEYAEPLHVFDPTNVPNEFQGTMRYAPLDVAKLKEFIDKDIEDNSAQHVKKVAVITHCDIRFNTQLRDAIVEAVGADRFICANGPTHEHMDCHYTE